jgi:iron complex outermembrane receptor protein
MRKTYNTFFISFIFFDAIYAQPADSSILLDAVQVEAYQSTGYLRTIPGSLSVLTGDAIGLTDGTNLAGTLNSLPGVTMQSGTYTTNRIVLRGMGSRTPYNTNRIRVYLNDIPLTTSDGISTPEELDLLSLGRMEVIKGPSSALFGSGLGGSINLYSPVTTHNEGNLSAQFGSFETGKVHLSGAIQKGNTNFQAGLGHLGSAGYRENNQYRRTSFISGTTWKQDGMSVDLTLLLIGVNGGIPSSLGKTMFEEEPQSAAPNWEAIEGYKKYLKGIVGIALKNRLSERMTNKFVIFGRGNDSYERRPFNNLDDRSLSIGLRNKLSLHTRKSEWVFGAEWIAEQYDWKLDKDSVLLNKNHEDRRLFNLFAIFNYRPNPKLNISLAGALNHISYRLTDEFLINGDQSGNHNFPLIISPRIGINYSPGKRWAIYASAGHGYSSPSPEETLLPEGDVNPEIKPEQGIQFELGARINILRNILDLDAAIYHIEVKDLLVTKRITEDIFTGINAGRTRHQGLELRLQSNLFEYSYFPGRLGSVFSYARSLNRFIDFTDDGLTYDGNQLPGIPDQTLYLQFTWDPLKVLSIFADMYYAGDQYLNDMNDASYPGYLVSNLKVSTAFPLKKAGTISLYVGINNFTDTHYASMLVVNATASGGNEPRYYYPGLPRHSYAGIIFDF